MNIKLFNDSVLHNDTQQMVLCETDGTNRSIIVYKFENIILTGHSTYYPDVLFYQFSNENRNTLVFPIKEMSMSLNKRSYYEENGMTFNYVPLQQTKISTNVIEIKHNVFFFIYNTENYYHFIYDTLSYLYSYFELKKRYPQLKLKLLMNYNKNKSKLLPFVKESLEILGIKDEDIIIHDDNNNSNNSNNSNVVYSNIYVSSSLTHNGMSNSPPRKEIFEIYNKMINNVCNSKTNKLNYMTEMKKIYISRRTWVNDNGKGKINIGTNYTMRRKLMNEDALVEKLTTEHGFIEFFGENYSMSEKIMIFNNADIILGAIGGTIASCAFCRQKECKIVALVSPDFMRLNNRMKYLFDDRSEENKVIMFVDSCLDCKADELAQNIRIEITNKDSRYYGRIGEIVMCADDKKTISGNKKRYLIRLANNMIGLCADDIFNEIVAERNEFKTLDNGINSSWKINIDKLFTKVLTKV
jgi:hypothetical protein